MAENVRYTDGKDKIWNALKEARAQLEAAKSGNVDFAAEAKAKKDTQTVEAAQKVSAQSIGVEIANLQKTVQLHFSQISNALTEKIGDLTSIEDAIAIKKAEIKELLGIEAEAINLAAVVTAKEKLAANYDAKFNEDLALNKAQLEEIKSQIAEAKKAWEIEMSTARQQLKDEQQKARDEFEYGFTRYKREKNDSLSDDLKSRRRVHDEHVEKVNKELAEREAAATSREEAIAKAEAHVAELEERVRNFPVELQVAISEAKEAGRKDAERTAAIKVSYMEKDHKNEVSALQKQIELLEIALGTERAAHAGTHEKLEAANNRVQDIAMSAVKSAAESKVVVQQPSYSTLSNGTK